MVYFLSVLLGNNKSVGVLMEFIAFSYTVVGCLALKLNLIDFIAVKKSAAIAG